MRRVVRIIGFVVLAIAVINTVSIIGSFNTESLEGVVHSIGLLIGNFLTPILILLASSRIGKGKPQTKTVNEEETKDANICR